MLSWVNTLTHLLNHWFALPIDRVLFRLDIPPLHPARPISNTLTEEMVIVALMVAFFIAVRLMLSVEHPTIPQHFAETVHEFVEDQASQVMGQGYDPHLPILTCLLVFILLCNCFGLLPHIETPTSNPVVPLGLALCAFVYFNWKGIRSQGVLGYLKHFMGPVGWLAFLMFPIEIFSNLIRILSLTVRLFANMLASDLITVIFFSIFPLALPLLGLGLHFIVAVIQAYIFMLLNAIYLAEATAHPEH